MADHKEIERTRLLIIDDDEDFSHIVKAFFERSGNYEVMVANNGEDGLYIAGKSRPDTILLDVNMPGKDGLSVLTELKGNKATAGIPVFMFSVVNESQTKLEAVSKFAERYFLKTADLNEIKSGMEDILKVRKVHRKKVKEKKTASRLISRIGRKKPVSSGRKVLVIDDDESMCNQITHYLESLKFEVTSSTDPTKAIKLFDSIKPDIVILDVIMRKLDGLELLCRIKELKTDARVIIITAVRDATVIKDIIKFGADDVLVKPFSLDQVQVTVTRHISAMKRDR